MTSDRAIFISMTKPYSVQIRNDDLAQTRIKSEEYGGEGTARSWTTDAPRMDHRRSADGPPTLRGWTTDAPLMDHRRMIKKEASFADEAPADMRWLSNQLATNCRS